VIYCGSQATARMETWRGMIRPVDNQRRLVLEPLGQPSGRFCGRIARWRNKPTLSNTGNNVIRKRVNSGGTTLA
jgi:hypothetical protein